jgi:hypothetical protein
VTDEKPPSLDQTSADYVTSLAKAALGAVPFAGSLLAEIAGTVIPKQRIERLASFAAILDRRIAGLEQDAVRAQLRDENFTELVEEAMRQAARSTSEERREYIASLVARSLTSEDIKHLESKHLLRILGELNDVEVLWLRFYLEPSLGGDEEFRERHKEALEPISPTMGSPIGEVDRAAVQDSYQEHLARLGLLRPRYRTDAKTKQPVFDRMTAAPEVRGYEITWLGRLLLRFVGLSEEKAG